MSVKGIEVALSLRVTIIYVASAELQKCWTCLSLWNTRGQWYCLDSPCVVCAIIHAQSVTLYMRRQL